MFFSVSAPWAPSRVDMCALQIFIIIIIIIIILSTIGKNTALYKLFLWKKRQDFEN